VIALENEFEQAAYQALTQVFQDVDVLPTAHAGSGDHELMIEMSSPELMIDQDCPGIFRRTYGFGIFIMYAVMFSQSFGYHTHARAQSQVKVTGVQGQRLIETTYASNDARDTFSFGEASPQRFGAAVSKALADLAEETSRNLYYDAKLRKYAQQIALRKDNTVGSNPATSKITSQVDAVPESSEVADSHRHALVIGIENYREHLPKAEFAYRDARVMTNYLIRSMGYPEENVVTLTNDHATRGDIEKYVEHWLPNRVEAGDTVFVYFSGHGAPNAKTLEPYLVPYDGDPSFLDSTGFSIKRLYSALGKLPARDIVVVLDSCFSGSGGRSVIAKGARPAVIMMDNPLSATENMTILAASGPDQISNTYNEQGHGLLTYFLLKGLQGEGDLNNDGVIDMSELYAFVKPGVQRIARREFNADQTPQLLKISDQSRMKLSDKRKYKTRPQ
jgi:hypothetical protein